MIETLKIILSETKNLLLKKNLDSSFISFPQNDKDENSSRARGFTLIEIMVVIFIIALGMSVVVSQSGIRERRAMSTTANSMAGAIRYLYNKAASEGKNIRLIINIDEKNYWAESSNQQVMLGLEEDEEEEEIEEGEEGAAPKGPSFAKEESRILKTKKLPKSVFIKDVFVEHLEAPVEGGKVAIHFFPNGYVEKAIINLRNEDDDDHIAIETESVSGQASTYGEYKALEINE